MVEMLMAAGPVLHGGMGSSPLSALELEAWARGTATTLTPWEFRVLMRLSAEYLVELQQAADVNRPPPYVDLLTPERRAGVAKHIRSLLRG